MCRKKRKCGKDIMRESGRKRAKLKKVCLRVRLHGAEMWTTGM